ncbi:hypothetical protein I4U23_013830 [Adineta vaga]|nr:hypothetical protein I4U23_013830 [Adineta vaga]
MFQGKLSSKSIYYQLFILILLHKTSSKSIIFSYRTCLPNIDLLNIEHYSPLNSQFFRLVTKDFRLHILYTYENQTLEYQFGHFNFSSPYSASFDYQFQTAIDYYHEIDAWHYVNITFDDYLSKVLVSFGGDETRLIPLIDYPIKNLTTKLNVHVLVDEQQTNVTCLLPYSGFNTNYKNCFINIKTCEYQTCTSTNSAEQYCPLFKIFDCRPFTDLECGLKTIPVRCLQNHCQNRGVCYVDLLRNLTQCVCPSGFAGNQCQYSIDECQSSPCPKHSHCIDLPNSYTCVCDPGWTGSDCSEDIDECKTIQPCKAARTCINLPGTYKCDCLDSFGGQNCEMTLDPCLSQPCLNDAIKCHPILESNNVVFRCTCQAGFTGHRCETNINDCEGVVCSTNNTHCVDGLNSYDCLCKANFKQNPDRSCTEQNPCYSSPCHSNATCYNLNGGQYRCMCPPTYTGIHCTEDIDECTVFPSICRNGGTCINEIGSYRCFCSAGWTGPTCAKAIDYCLSQPCNRNGTCINKINGFECRCLSTYRGDVCQYDINECLVNPCMNNGTCHNYVGGYHCQCSMGYFGDRCQYSPLDCQHFKQANLSIKCTDPQLCVVNDTKKLDELNQLSANTCKNEQDQQLDTYFICINERPADQCQCPTKCLDLINGYQCQCESGWFGYNCDRQQKELSKSLISRLSLSSIFHLHNSSINISKILPYRSSLLPIRIQYEFRTTLKQSTLLAIGQRFQQELIHNRIVTHLDKKIMLSTFVDHRDQWNMIIIEVFPLWIDVRIGRNSMSQRFYVPHPSLENDLQKEIIFGYRNYSGCVRQIEITYSQAYSIVLTDQLIETNEKLTVGCEKTNACHSTVCRKNELCHDHWFYHTCECQSPFFGEKCDQIAPIVTFNQTSLVDISLSTSISNISFFFNTLQANGTLFELISSSKASRITRDLTFSQNRSSARILGSLVNGRFRLTVIDHEPKFQEYELRNEQRLNDGRPHQIQLDLHNNRLIIDSIYNESLIKLNNRIIPNKFQLNPDQILTGWLQDLRINNQLISLNNPNQTNKNFNKTIINMKELTNNPCYPYNPCRNQGTCLVTNSHQYICQCENDWFGQNCSQINLCNYNNSSLCPDGFRCQTTNDKQECLAIGTFEGNSSRLKGIFNYSTSLSSNELTFRLRAYSQSAHLLTIRNLFTSKYFSLYFSSDQLIYRHSNLTDDLIIPLNQQTFRQWTTFHFQWLENSTLMFNHTLTYTMNLTLEDEIFSLDHPMEITIGDGFRGCLEYVLLGNDLYVPFYENLNIGNLTYINEIQIEQFENILINNCSFNNVCANMLCHNGQCINDFDRGKCLCNQGWEGDTCEQNIDECQQGNNCSIEHSVCVDHLDGYYTCKCQQGFTGKYCETNIDECSSSPCGNNGICTDLVNGYRCNCTNNYISSNCSISLDSTCFGRVKSCQNNGTCILKSTNLYVDNPKTECQCRDGYDGQWCENDLCSKLKCRHNGTCQRLPHAQAQCLCTAQWHGNECQHDVNECFMNSTNLCLNNGTCWNYPGGYTCRCLENYLGSNCERKHVCLEHTPCLNNGLCRPDGEQYYCECSSKFTGLHCEYPTCESAPCHNNGTCTPDSERGFVCNCTDTGYEDEKCLTEINECLSNPCHNNGSCIDQINGYICACPKAFIGHQCENKKFLALLGFSYHYVIWPGVAVLLLLIIILLSVVISRIRESRRSRGTYRPALNENGQSSRVEFSMILKPPPEERLI